jgi:pimeloyl-ACP methyl ester carboxylesterase
VFSGRKSTIRRRVLLWCLRLFIVVCLAFLAGVALLYFRQHSMLYHPRPYDAGYEYVLPPDGIQLAFNTIAGKQVAFYLPRGASADLPKRIWVAFCGNASLALDWIWLIGQDPNPENAFLLIDYPGYGKSEGHASIATTRAAADKALEALATHLSVSNEQIESRLHVIGHSWGTAVALDFSTRHPVRRLILISIFTTLREEAAFMVGKIPSYLLIENYDNRARLHELAQRAPAPRVVIFHGTNDEIIPMRMGRELVERSPTISEFHPVAGGDHISVIAKAANEILAAMNQ